MKPAKPDFISIATPLVKRGFRVTPVHPETKMGVMKNWQNFQITSEEEVITFAKYYRHHNVAVVGKRSPGRHMFLDDDSGIAARIEAETGEKIPATYTVASRPDSNPIKRHFYFLQTDYSFQQFALFAENHDPWKSKNVNRRDLTRFELSRTGLRIHPTLYDLKGIGGGSFVVAAGSLRAPDDGHIERYTCMNDGEVIPIPKWLVDWFVQDIKTYLAAKVKEQTEKYAARCKERQERGESAVKDIAEEDVFDFLRWKAGVLSKLGVIAAPLETALTSLVERYCDKGNVFTASVHGQELIREIAFDSWEIGTSDWFYQMGEEKRESLMVPKAAPSKQQMMENIIARFPDRISASTAFERLTEELLKDGYIFDKHKDRSSLYRARADAGFEYEGRLYWVRS
jgi:hypothetical protein